jgi:hypothetical protein
VWWRHFARRIVLLTTREEDKLPVFHAMPVLPDTIGTDGELPTRMCTIAEANPAELVNRAGQTCVRRVRA